jgi:hypothetical protein
MVLRATVQRVDTAAHLVLVGGNPDPVLEAIGRGRGFDTITEQQQAGDTLDGEQLPSVAVVRPPNEHDVHDRDSTDATLRLCFVTVNRWLTIDRGRRR